MNLEHARSGRSDVVRDNGLVKPGVLEHPPIPLTPAEHRILDALNKDPIAVVSQRDLARIVWNDDDHPLPEGDVLEVKSYMTHIHQKLGIVIYNIPYKGYTLTSNAEVVEAFLEEESQYDEVRRGPNGNLVLFLDRSIVTSPRLERGRYAELSPIEAALLKRLLEEPNKVATLASLSQAVEDETGRILRDSHNIATHIFVLRFKLGDIESKEKSSTRLIHAINAHGYSLTSNEKYIQEGLIEQELDDTSIVRYGSADKRLILNIDRGIARVKGENSEKLDVQLTPNEGIVLAALMQEPSGIVNEHSHIGGRSDEEIFLPGSLKNYVYLLRQKLPLIQIYTVSSEGYSLTSNADTVSSF